MNISSLLFKGTRKLKRWLLSFVNDNLVVFYFRANNVTYGKNLNSNGLPVIDIWSKGSIEIGHNFRMNNGSNYNRIGRTQRCSFVAMDGGKIVIGDDVAISGTAFFCTLCIEIGNHTKIGGNTVIYDTDFHSLNADNRKDKALDFLNSVSKSVKIGNNVFIGAHSTILKGVEIGDNSIIGACSVVTKVIPAGQIWAGNPAKFVKEI